MSDDIKKAFYYEAANSVGISALISTRFYSAGECPQAPTAPYAVYQVIIDLLSSHQGGQADANFARIQVSVYAADGAAAAAIRDAFKTEFMFFRGTMGGGGNTVTVLRAFVTEYNDLVTAPSNAAARGVVGELIDLEIWYAE